MKFAQPKRRQSQISISNSLVAVFDKETEKYTNNFMI